MALPVKLATIQALCLIVKDPRRPAGDRLLALEVLYAYLLSVADKGCLSPE